MRALLANIAEIPYRLARMFFIFALIAAGFAIIALMRPYGPVVAGMSVAAALTLIFKRGQSALHACGTARWATEEDVRQAGMLDGKPGLIIGRVGDNRQVRLASGIAALLSGKLKASHACRKFLLSISPRFGGTPPIARLSQAVHTAVFAPTGIGKGVSCVVPFLRDCRDSSCVVVDFKGELAALTADYRRRKFGHRIVVLDPFRIFTKTPDSFNPLDFIGKNSSTAIDECRDLAESLVVRTGQEKEPHWNDSAEAWLAAFVAIVVQMGDADDRSLQSVRDLFGGPEKISGVIKILCESNAWGGMLARLGQQLTHYRDRELGSTLTTTNRFLSFLDSPAIAESTAKSSFDPAELRKGKMTVYLVLPPDHARTQSPLLRMWISGLLRAIVRGGLQERHKVHFVLDEAASLGHLNQIDDAVDKYRGYGVRLLFFFQSLGQIKKCFPEQEQTFLSNVSEVYFGVNELQTADHISQRLGEETIAVESGGTNWSTSYQRSDHNQRSYSRSDSGSRNFQQQARRLLKPEEVMALGDRIAITFVQGVPPIWSRLIRYYERDWPLLRGLHRAAGTLILAVAMFAAALMLAVAPPGGHAVQPRPSIRHSVPVTRKGVLR